jgi:hypothetical protein
MTGASSTFWSSAQSGEVGRIHSSLYVVMPITARMEIIRRTGEESFEDVVTKLYARMPFTCAINGPMYALSGMGYTSLGLGNVDAKEVLPEGLVISQG